MTYFAYLDEFGHVGPYVARTDPKFHESPVFGLAGIVLPASQIRSFGTWFYQRKCKLLNFEIERSGKHPALWEKKGSSLYTVTNVTRYPELRRSTNRLLNKIEKIGGFVFYVGVHKTSVPTKHNSNRLYTRVFLETIKRIDQFCVEDCNSPRNFTLLLDEHSQRPELITQAAKSMYARIGKRRRQLIEPPFHLESHRYQTLQAADWVAGLIGRLGAIWTEPTVWPENRVFRRYFEHKIKLASRRSGIRNRK